MSNLYRILVPVVCGVLTGALPCAGGTGSAPFLRGDANGSEVVDIADAVTTLDYLFGAGSASPCHDALDTNDDGQVNVADAIATLTYLFGAGVIPLPFPVSGFDPTADALPCDGPCITPEALASITSLGSIAVSHPTPPMSFDLVVATAEFDPPDSSVIQFGEMAYDPLAGTLSCVVDSWTLSASLAVDGPFGLDFDCSATITVGGSLDVELDQAQLEPDFIVVYGVEGSTFVPVLGSVSLASCGLPSSIANPLQSAITNWAIPFFNAVAPPLAALFEGAVVDLLGSFTPTATPVCLD